jgi:uncharacterized membrane protein
MRKPHAWYSALVLAIAGAMSAIAFPRAPDRLPVHWGVSGEPDRFGSRLEALWLIPAVMAGVWVLMRVMPRVDPRRANYARMQSTYDFMVNAILTVMLAFHSITVATALGYDVPIHRVVPVVLGLFLIALGNVLPRARSNWTFGVRTPWTLSSDRVWARTHRVAGYLIAAAGAVTLFSATLPGAWPVIAAMTSIGLAAVGAVIYSYLIWKQEGRS